MNEHEDTFIVIKRPPLEGARKDICHDSGEPYTDEPGQVSEWAMALALSGFKLGQEITIKELEEAIEEAVVQQALDDLVAAGLVEVLWNEEINDIVYRVPKQ